MSEQIIVKQCRICEEKKALSEFYKVKSKKDGHESVCIICKKLYNKSDARKATLQRYVRSEKFRVQQARYRRTDKCRIVKRRYAHSEKGKLAQIRKHHSETHKQYRMIYDREHPKYEYAKRAVNHAIRDGKLAQASTLKCSRCPAQAEQYHHHLGYEPEHWLDVIPVCVPCHAEIHVVLRKRVRTQLVQNRQAELFA